MTFTELLKLWHGFFTLEGEATASFAGLLFVALSLNADRFRDPANRHLVLLARQTFSNLLLLIAMSLLALSPVMTRMSYGVSVFASVLTGFFSSIQALREERRARGKARIKLGDARAYYGPAVIYVLLAIPAGEMAFGGVTDIMFLSFGSIMLLVASARNAWLLLVLPSAKHRSDS